MRYRVKEGAALFSMCNAYFIFPSRKLKNTIPFIIQISDELAASLRSDSTVDFPSSLTDADLRQVQRLIKLGYVEEM